MVNFTVRVSHKEVRGKKKILYRLQASQLQKVQQLQEVPNIHSNLSFPP